MYPSLPVHEIRNQGEKLVYNKLKNSLPDSYAVIYNWPSSFYCKKLGIYSDRELDFIIIIPHWGLLFVEVKGTKELIFSDNEIVALRNNNTEFTCNQILLKLQGRMYAIVNRISDKIFHCDKNQFPCNYSHMAVFPQGEIEKKPLNFDTPIITASKFQNMYNHIINHIESIRTHKNLSEPNFMKIVNFFKADIVDV